MRPSSISVSLLIHEADLAVLPGAPRTATLAGLHFATTMHSHALPIALGVAFLAGVGAHAAEPARERLARLLDVTPAIHSFKSTDYAEARFIVYRDTDAASPTLGLELCVLEAPRGTGRLRVKDLRVDRPPAEVFRTAFQDGPLAVMTGGFFGLDRTGNPIPLGLIVSNGKTLSPEHPWTSGGFVAATEAGVEIVPVAQLRQARKFSEVAQSRPLLVENGRDGIRKPTADRFDRSAVAVDGHGGLYFFVIHEPAGSAASLAEFSHLLLKFRSTQGRSLRWALAMDGGPGAHLYVPSLSKHCGAGTPTYVPNALYIAK